MTNTETITWHDYKPGDVTTKLHRLFRHSEEVDNMSVQIGEVRTFPHPKRDEEQMRKILEEVEELRVEWENVDKCGCSEGYGCPNVDRLKEEAADVFTAICNLLAAIGVDDMRGAMAECEARNRERGRL